MFRVAFIPGVAWAGLASLGLAPVRVVCLEAKGGMLGGGGWHAWRRGVAGVRSPWSMARCATERGSMRDGDPYPMADHCAVATLGCTLPDCGVTCGGAVAAPSTPSGGAGIETAGDAGGESGVHAVAVAISPISQADSTKSATATVTVATPAGASPTLTAGVWVNITPVGLQAQMLTTHYGTPYVEIDRSNPRTLYLCADENGLWKTTDGGTSWVQLGNSTGKPITGDSGNVGTTATYLDSPVEVRVDPATLSIFMLRRASEAARWDSGSPPMAEIRGQCLQDSYLPPPPAMSRSSM